MCSPKTMLKIGVVIAIPLAVGFFAFPQFRVALIGLAPFALFAICPLSMIFCMKGMGGDKKGSAYSSCGNDNHKKGNHALEKAESK